MPRGFYALNFFSPAFVDQLKRGRKTATIRLGDKSRKYERGQLLWVTVGHQHSPREKIFTAVIDDVEVKKARDLSPRDIEHDNPEFRRVEETLGFMRQIYGREIDLEETVTVVRFSRVHEPPPGFGNGEPRRATERDVPVEYRFLTHLAARIAARAGLGRDLRPARLAAWWRGVEDVVELDPGDETGVGSHSRLTWRSKLPYDLVFEATDADGREAAADRGRRLRRAHRHRPLAAVRAGRGHRGALRVERPHDEALDERAGAAAAPRVRVEPRLGDAQRRHRDRRAARRPAARARLSCVGSKSSRLRYLKPAARPLHCRGLWHSRM